MSRRRRQFGTTPMEAVRPVVAWTRTAGVQELMPPVDRGVPLKVADVDQEAKTITIRAEPMLLCVGLGKLKDGRHVTFEADTQGDKVLEWRPLCARPTLDGPERAWWQVAYAKLFLRRALTETESAANVRDSAGVLAEHFEHGMAVALHQDGKKWVAMGMTLDGARVVEPVILSMGPKDWVWLAIDSWAGKNMLPRRRLP